MVNHKICSNHDTSYHKYCFFGIDLSSIGPTIQNKTLKINKRQTLIIFSNSVAFFCLLVIKFNGHNKYYWCSAFKTTPSTKPIHSAWFSSRSLNTLISLEKNPNNTRISFTKTIRDMYRLDRLRITGPLTITTSIKEWISHENQNSPTAECRTFRCAWRWAV